MLICNDMLISLITVKGCIKNSDKLYCEDGREFNVLNKVYQSNIVYEGYFQIKILEKGWVMLNRLVITKETEI